MQYLPTSLHHAPSYLDSYLVRAGGTGGYLLKQFSQLSAAGRNIVAAAQPVAQCIGLTLPAQAL